MRKLLFVLLLLLLAACCAFAAAETQYSLAPCAGRMALDETMFIVLTPDNLADHPDLLSSVGKTGDELKADWAERGVLLQAWTKKMDACLEVSVRQDDEARKYYDLEQQTRQIRNEYLKAHKANPVYTEQGLSIIKPEWKKQKLGGNFLVYEYKQTVGDKVLRGIARKTVRNGYTILLDYQVFDRLPRGTDENYLNKIANTVEFDTVVPASVDDNTAAGSGEENTTAAAPLPADASGLLQVTVGPPKETNEDTFTVEGHATPGGQLTGVLMRWSLTDPLTFTTEATRAGNFKLKVTMPDEGLWLLTLTLDVGGTVVAEEVFSTTTYSKTLIPVTMDADVPSELTADETVISGVTSKGVDVQCIVTNGKTTFDKTIRTNGTGVFRFKVPTKEEAEYDITLIFSKKHYNTNRVSFTARRNMSPEDTRKRQTVEAIHPSYSALTRKLDTYIGKTMVYDVYVTEVAEIEEEWVITCALRKNQDNYLDYLVFMADDDPGLEEGSKVKLYGTCIGAYQIQSEEENAALPGFDFLFKED